MRRTGVHPRKSLAALALLASGSLEAASEARSPFESTPSSRCTCRDCRKAGSSHGIHLRAHRTAQGASAEDSRAPAAPRRSWPLSGEDAVAERSSRPCRRMLEGFPAVAARSRRRSARRCRLARAPAMFSCSSGVRSKDAAAERPVRRGERGRADLPPQRDARDVRVLELIRVGRRSRCREQESLLRAASACRRCPRAR